MISLLAIVLGLIVLAVAYFHYTQGFFSATISAILVIFSAVFAVSYHETIIEKFLAGYANDVMHAVVVLVLFAGLYIVLRTLFDKMVPHDVTFPAAYTKLGGGLMGIVAGVFAAGVIGFAAQQMPFGVSALGHARLHVEDKDATLPNPEGGQQLTRPIREQLGTAEPLHSEAAQGDIQKLMLPADDLLLDVVKNVSNTGALASRPLDSIHPDWLMEMFGQRIGMQSVGQHVAVNADKRTDFSATAEGGNADAGVYLLEKQIKGKAHDFPGVSRASVENPFPKGNPLTSPFITVIIRTYLGPKARDTRDRTVRFSMGSFRLVTQKAGPPGVGGMVWADYYPIGTVDEANTFYRSAPDDYMFIGGEAVMEGAPLMVDLVFQLEPVGFLASGKDPRQNNKISDGTFIEFKRLARVDLSGQQIRPMSDYKARKDATGIMRKPLVKNPKKRPGSSDGCGPAEEPAAPAAQPAPAAADDGRAAALEQAKGKVRAVIPGVGTATVPGQTRGSAAPAAAPAAAAAPVNLGFTVTDLDEQRKFYAPVRLAKGSSGDIQVPGGTVSLEGDNLRSINLGPVGLDKLNAGAGEAINRLATPPSMSIVVFEATPAGADPWTAWKDKLDQFSMVDKAGGRHNLLGVWAIVTGDKEIVARFNVDGNVSLADYTPSGPPSKLYFAFGVPIGQQAKAVMFGNGLVKSYE